MADEVIDFVRVQFAQVNIKLDQLTADVRNLKVRMSGVESEGGHIRIGLGEVNSRLDQMDARIERIERRLDLGETA